MSLADEKEAIGHYDSGHMWTYSVSSSIVEFMLQTIHEPPFEVFGLQIPPLRGFLTARGVGGGRENRGETIGGTATRRPPRHPQSDFFEPLGSIFE